MLHRGYPPDRCYGADLGHLSTYLRNLEGPHAVTAPYGVRAEDAPASESGHLAAGKDRPSGRLVAIGDQRLSGLHHAPDGSSMSTDHHGALALGERLLAKLRPSVGGNEGARVCHKVTARRCDST